MQNGMLKKMRLIKMQLHQQIILFILQVQMLQKKDGQINAKKKLLKAEQKAALY